MTQGPYTGLRVLEIAADVTGAFAGQIVADRGAEVIKIEPPEGDPLRHRNAYTPGESKLFQWLNRNKRSAVLNLDDPEAQSIVRRLVKTVDVILTTASEEALTTWRLGYDTLAIEHPQLVYVWATPFGRKGPWAGRPANDLVMQAFSGLMASEGKLRQDGAPEPFRSTEMVAFATGIMMAFGVSTGVYHRARTGEGQFIEACQLSTALFLQMRHTVDNPAADANDRLPALEKLKTLRQNGGGFAELRQARAGVAYPPGNIFYRAFRTRDGAVFIGALSRPLREKVRQALPTDFLGRDDPAYDPTDPAYLAHAKAHEAETEVKLRQKSNAEWMTIFERGGVPAGEVVFPEDLSDSEQARANHYVMEVEHETAGCQVHVAPAARFSKWPNPVLKGAPSLGSYLQSLNLSS
jgi:crotonobetainyl-CoA:carnitine CoA-transferase CaiB-like acyl-CoA transferase